MQRLWLSALYSYLVVTIGCGGEANHDRQIPEKTLPPFAASLERRSQIATEVGGLSSEALSPIRNRSVHAPLFEMLSPDRTGVDFQMQLPDVEQHVREVIHLNVNGGISTGDFDGDGDLDPVVNNADAPVSLYRNLSDQGHRIRIHLRGQASNRFGIGAANESPKIEHREESYNDFGLQPLLPNRLSELGPAMAWADVDGDGDNDCYVGGAKGQPGRLFLNLGAVSFRPLPVVDLEQDRECEDTGAVFFDADGDGDQDLHVVSGSIEHNPEDVAYRDRLYLNDGDGQFRKAAEDALPDLRDSGSVAAACDFDRDGDTDFVVTNFGLNTKYDACPLKPELLYYGDFEGLGDSQIVEARYEGQSLYPRRDLAALRNAMPTVMAKYKSFDEFAGSTLADLFTQERLDRAKRFAVNALESGVLINEGQFRFRFEALPALAQIAPSLGVDIGDVNEDGHPDLVMAQNFYGPQPETGRMDGGVGLLLVGNGRGNFEPVWPDHSGIVVPEDARKVRIVELDGDGRPDLVFAVHNGVWRMFLNHASKSDEARQLTNQ